MVTIAPASGDAKNCSSDVVDEILRQIMVPYRNHLTTIFLFFRFLLSNVPEKAYRGIVGTG